MENLGFWVILDGVKPINKKIEAIKIWSHLIPEINNGSLLVYWITAAIFSQGGHMS